MVPHVYFLGPGEKVTVNVEAIRTIERTPDYVACAANMVLTDFVTDHPESPNYLIGQPIPMEYRVEKTSDGDLYITVYSLAG